MGWGSGSELMTKVITGLQNEDLDRNTREKVYGVLIPAMQEHDWDTEDECLGLDDAFDFVWKELNG
jgi:hypothetical protein